MLLASLAAFAAAAFVAYLVTPLIRRLAAAGQAVDKPDRDRKRHRRLVSLWGGLAVLPALAAGVLAALFWTEEGQLLAHFRFNMYGRRLGLALLAACGLLLLGLWDDKKPLPPKVKLLGQMAAALLAAGAGFFPESFLNPFSLKIYILWPAFGFILAVVWLLFVMNAFNFLDGLDGLACGQVVIAGAALSLAAGLMAGHGGLVATRMQLGIAAVLAAAAAGSGLGFWKFNFWPAKIFLGEAGSVLFGFSLGLVVLLMVGQTATAPTLAMLLLILGWPIADTLIAIWRRIKSRRPISRADHGHLHHRLVAEGLHDRAAVAFIHFWMLLLAGLGLALCWI